MDAALAEGRTSDYLALREEVESVGARKETAEPTWEGLDFQDKAVQKFLEREITNDRINIDVARQNQQDAASLPFATAAPDKVYELFTLRDDYQQHVSNPTLSPEDRAKNQIISTTISEFLTTRFPLHSTHTPEEQKMADWTKAAKRRIKAMEVAAGEIMQKQQKHNKQTDPLMQAERYAYVQRATAMRQITQTLEQQ